MRNPMKMLGSHQDYYEVDANGKVINSLSLPIAVSFPRDGTGESEAAGVLRNSELLSFCKMPAVPDSELAQFLAEEGHDATSMYSLATQAFNLDSAGPAQTAVAKLLELLLKRGKYTKDQVLRILCVMHKNDNARSKGMQQGFQAYIEALQRDGRLKACDVIDTENENIGELKKLDDLANLRSCIQATFLNKAKHYSCAADYARWFRVAAATVPQDLLDVGVTALDPEGLEHVAKNNAMMGRSTGRFMMSVALDACIAINFAYMTLYSKSAAWEKKSEVALNAAHKVAKKAFESPLYRPMFRASAMAGELSSQIHYMIIYCKTVADLGKFLPRLLSDLTTLLSDAGIEALETNVRGGLGVCAALETISDEKLFTCWDDGTFVRNNTASAAARYRTEQINKGDACTGDASATNTEVMEPLVYFLVALNNELTHFFGDYVAGGALDPASLSEYQRRVAAAVQAHSINMESDFAVLSGIVDRHGGQKGEVTVPMLMAKLQYNRKKKFADKGGGAAESAHAQTVADYERSLTDDQLDAEHEWYASIVTPFAEMIKSDKDAQGAKKREDKAAGAEEGRKKLITQENEARAALARIKGLTLTSFDTAYTAATEAEKKAMVEQARKDIKTVYGNFKVTGFDKVHKKLSQVIDQQAVKLDPVANAKVKLVSQKMGTTARMVGHQLANVRLLILWLQNQERSFEEMNVTRAVPRETRVIVRHLSAREAMSAAKDAPVFETQGISNAGQRKREATTAAGKEGKKKRKKANTEQEEVTSAVNAGGAAMQAAEINDIETRPPLPERPAQILAATSSTTSTKPAAHAQSNPD